jgi:hypothetical protein
LLGKTKQGAIAPPQAKKYDEKTFIKPVRCLERLKGDTYLCDAWDNKVVLSNS